MFNYNCRVLCPLNLKSRGSEKIHNSPRSYQLCEEHSDIESSASSVLQTDASSSPKAPTLSPIIPVSTLASTSASSHEDHEHLDPAPKLKTYKLVKDNIDKTIKPRRIDSQTQSLHYFHTYAVRNRIHVSHFSDRASVPKRDSIDVTTVLPKGLKNPVSPKKAHDFLYSVKV